jgi:ribonuclease HI
VNSNQFNLAGLKRVIIQSHGGCEVNPASGGWAAVLEFGRAPQSNRQQRHFQ